MNEAVHQLLQLILQGLHLGAADDRGAVGLVVGPESPAPSACRGAACGLEDRDRVGGDGRARGDILVVMFIRGLRAFGRIAAAFWTMAVTLFGILSFVVVAGLFSRGFHNEGAGGLLSTQGQPLALQIQAGEKIHQVYELTVTNPGGHSSRPVPENAIYRLAAATQKVSQLSFPIEVTPVVREYFRVTGPLVGGELGSAMSGVAKNPGDTAALSVLTKDASYNAILHTTCVATQLEAGHAANALPQRATATLSCRVMQGTSPEQVRDVLTKTVNDPQVKVAIVRRREGSKAPDLSDEVMKPVRKIAAKMWPGVPVAPSMTAGATDGRFLMNAGIPTYGLSGIFSTPGEGNAHGLNEKVRTKSLYEGRDFLEGVVREYVK